MVREELPQLTQERAVDLFWKQSEHLALVFDFEEDLLGLRNDPNFIRDEALLECQLLFAVAIQPHEPIDESNCVFAISTHLLHSSIAN